MAAVAEPKNLADIIGLFIGIGTTLIPFLGVVAFLVFVWGVARFIKAAGNGEDLKDSKKLLIWGVVGLFVLVTIWGIISFVKNELGLKPDVLIPQIRFNTTKV